MFQCGPIRRGTHPVWYYFNVGCYAVPYAYQSFNVGHPCPLLTQLCHCSIWCRITPSASRLFQCEKTGRTSTVAWCSFNVGLTCVSSILTVSNSSMWCRSTAPSNIDKFNMGPTLIAGMAYHLFQYGIYSVVGQKSYSFNVDRAFEGSTPDYFNVGFTTDSIQSVPNISMWLLN